MKSLSDSIGQGRITCCTDLKNTHTTVRIVSMCQSRKIFLETQITVTQLLMDQSALSLTQECAFSATLQVLRDLLISGLVMLTQVDIVWWMHVTIRKRQTIVPCGCNLSLFS